MEKKQNQRVALTKRLLKESLMQLLKKKDINKISVKELCENAGINRTTFYNHYGSPYDVLSEMEDDLIEGIPVVLWDKSYESKQTFIKETTIIFRYLYDNIDLTRLLLRNNNIESGFARKLFHFPATQQAINELISGEHDSASMKLIITFLENGAYSLLREWIIQDIPKSPFEIAELLANIIQKGKWGK